MESKISFNYYINSKLRYREFVISYFLVHTSNFKLTIWDHYHLLIIIEPKFQYFVTLIFYDSISDCNYNNSMVKINNKNKLVKIFGH